MNLNLLGLRGYDRTSKRMDRIDAVMDQRIVLNRLNATGFENKKANWFKPVGFLKGSLEDGY